MHPSYLGDASTGRSKEEAGDRAWPTQTSTQNKPSSSDPSYHFHFAKDEKKTPTHTGEALLIILGEQGQIFPLLSSLCSGLDSYLNSWSVVREVVTSLL
jgi:hypothetical protein